MLRSRRRRSPSIDCHQIPRGWRDRESPHPHASAAGGVGLERGHLLLDRARRAGGAARGRRRRGRGVPRLARRKGSFLRYPAHVALATNNLYWLMRRWRPHIAHFYLPGPCLIGAHVAIAARIPIKIMSRRSLSDYQRNWPLVAKLERRLHTKMDAVIGNSRAVVRQLIEEAIPEPKVRLIYNGIEVSPVLPDRNEARQVLGLDSDTLVGVVIANLIHYKGHWELVRGLSHLEQELPANWRILVAGRDHGIRAELEELAAARGISHRIQFLGEYSDTPACSRPRISDF